MTKFAQMILNRGRAGGRQLLTADSIRQMTSKRTPASLATEYGYGWTTGLGVKGQGFGHSGAYCTFLFIDPKAAVAGILMVQHQRGWSGPEEKRIWPAFVRAVYDAASPGLVKPSDSVAAH